MHKLARCVRFSINPFLPQSTGRLPKGIPYGITAETIGYNSFCSKPTGDGLSIFLELSVELAGDVEPSTGFVVNVSDIDRSIRRFVVPIFAERIRADFQQRKHINLDVIAELLCLSRQSLADKFGKARLDRLSLKLNPFREVAMDSKNFGSIYFSEKFEFAATHTLWNDIFSKERNFEVFGKCANPTGHGHNYIVEVTIKKLMAGDSFSIADFEKIVADELIKIVDHKNLNVDVAEFSKVNPTVENIAAFAWRQLAGKFGRATLHRVTVWENDRTCCSYYE